MAFVSSIPVCGAVTSRASVCPNLSAFRGAAIRTAAPRRVIIFTMNIETIQTQIQKEMKKAEEATAKFGKTSKEAAMAWDVVEELEAKASHLKADQTSSDPLDEFCKDTPEADECRTYDS